MVMFGFVGDVHFNLVVDPHTFLKLVVGVESGFFCQVLVDGDKGGSGEDQGGERDDFLCGGPGVPLVAVAGGALDVFSSHSVIDELDDKPAEASIGDDGILVGMRDPGEERKTVISGEILIVLKKKKV